jgi:hypothetical protein
VALFIALGGVSYAALKLPANSVGTKQLKNKAVTLGKIAPSARGALHGAAGAPCPATTLACRGPQGLPGPAAVAIHVDSTHQVPDAVLATVGVWKIHASCTDDGTNSTISVHADGPADSSADGLEIDGTSTYIYSALGSSMEVGNDLFYPTSGGGVSEVSLDLYSASGGAHISLFKYGTGAGNAGGFRCKLSGTGYST